MEQIFEEFKRGLKQLKGKILDTILADLKKEQSQFGDLLNSLNQLRVSAWHGVHIGDLNRENVMAYFPYTINALKYGNSLQILINKLNEMGIKLDDEDGQLFVINGDTGQTLAPVSEFTKCFDIQLTDDFDLMQILEMYSYAKDNNSSCLRSKSLELALINDGLIALIKGIDLYLKNIKSIVEALDVETVKVPINDIFAFYYFICTSNLSVDEASKLLGKVLIFNRNYAKKNPNHKIKSIALVEHLAGFYNEDGSLKRNMDSDDFRFYMTLLGKFSKVYFELFDTLTGLLNNISLKNKSSQNGEMVEIEEKATLSFTDFIEFFNSNVVEESNVINPTVPVAATLSARKQKTQEELELLSYLRQYYVNGSLIAIPDNLEEFYLKLARCPIDESVKAHIKNLVETASKDLEQKILFSPLTDEQKRTYDEASKLLDNLNPSDEDYYPLKQHLGEILPYLSLYRESSEDKEEILAELATIFDELDRICKKHEKTDDASTNKYIFLLNKCGNPYICEDIAELDNSYKKTIAGLLSKIDKSYECKFVPIHGSDQPRYKMYEILSQRGHIAFIEIDDGIYVIIGADIPRNGYTKFNNRLVANLETIRAMEKTIKNPEMRDVFLSENAKYLSLITEEKGKIGCPKKCYTKPPHVPFYC